MRAVIQRVNTASVSVDAHIVSEIKKGLVILIGIAQDDTAEDTKLMAKKIVTLRIFEDQTGKMNLSAIDCNADVLAVSQFTLYGDTRKGRRPDFTKAAEFSRAQDIYNAFITELSTYGLTVKTGVYGAKMTVSLENDGPVTLILDCPP